MANIPVERTGTNWLPWLLGLLALALIGFFMFLAADDPDNDDDTVVMDDTVVVDDADVMDDVDLSDLYVTSVVGDNTFFVSEEMNGGLDHLVYLEEETTPGDATEGRYDVTDGQHIAITGEMMDTPGDLTPWGLTADQAGMVGPQYIRATSLTVLDGEMATGDVAGLTTLAGLDEALAAGTAAGMMTDLDDVSVTALVGDSTFYVGEGANRVLVVLESLGESQDGPGDGSDGVYDINVGDVIDLDAEVMAFRPGMRGTATLSQADQDEAATKRYVLVVNDRGSLSK